MGESPKVDHARRRRSTVDSGAADDLLENLGYTPQLSRNRSTLQVAFMSFVLASIPYGLATTLGYPLGGGGPVNIIWGWVLVSCIIVCVAASLGEITSVYPTAGGTSTCALACCRSGQIQRPLRLTHALVMVLIRARL